LAGWLHLPRLSRNQNADTHALKQRSAAIRDWPIDNNAQLIFVSSVEKAIFEQL
jgi:hypothetical protein